MVRAPMRCADLPRRLPLGSTLALLAACSGTVTVNATDAGAPRPDVQDVPTIDDTGPEAAVDVPMVVDTGPAHSGIGDPCTSDGAAFPPSQGTCGAGQVCLAPAIGFPDGYCSTVCQGTRCPSDSVCGRVQGYPVCLVRCTANSDCRAGYVCGASGNGSSRVCMVNDAPVGTRPDGSACFTAGTTGSHPAPALLRTAFTGANGAASTPRTDSFLEAEGNVAVHPMSGHVAVSYIALNGGGSVYMGTSHNPGTNTGWVGDGTVTDPAFNSSSDPVLDWGTDGTLRMTFIGLQRGATGQVTSVHVRYTESTDEGATWTTPTQVEPNGTCVTPGICDKPWILSAPPTNPGGPPVLYIGYLAQTSNSANLNVERSDDGGHTWSAPTRLAAAGPLGRVLISHNLIQLAAGSGGLVAAAWSGLTLGDGTGGGATSEVRFGSADNRVLFRRSHDGWRTTEGTRVVSRLTDSPVYTQPPVALDGNDTAHVAYVTGDATGAWDIVLATTTDGGASWHYRTVNDDPEPCATHMLPSMLVDPTTHAVHITWLENRFGEGATAYARCPADPSMPCARNQQVSDAAFTLTTSRNPMIWHGDYAGVALSSTGELWATWSDTRTGGPAMYTAHSHVRP